MANTYQISLCVSRSHATRNPFSHVFTSNVAMTLTLVAADGAVFTVERSVAQQSVVLKHLLVDLGETNAPVPIQNVSGPILSKGEG